jgi:hypothetical protein
MLRLLTVAASLQLLCAGACAFTADLCTGAALLLQPVPDCWQFAAMLRLMLVSHELYHHVHVQLSMVRW